MITVRNILGETVLTLESATDNPLVISVNGWAAGCYFIEVKDLTTESVSVEKLIVD